MVSYFMPIFVFLLAFIVVYVLLKKTEILGKSEPVALIISAVLSIIFVVRVILFNFVKFSSMWFSASVIGLFLLLVVLTFLPWKTRWGFFAKDNWVSWIFLGLVIIFFLVSSLYIL